MKLSEAFGKVEAFVEIVKITDAQNPHTVPDNPSVGIVWFDFEGVFKEAPVTGSFGIAQSKQEFEPDLLYAGYLDREQAFSVVWNGTEFVVSPEDEEEEDEAN